MTTIVLKRPPLTKSAKEERKQLRIERRKQLEKEQKALLKTVKARQEETKAQRIVVSVVEASELIAYVLSYGVSCDSADKFNLHSNYFSDRRSPIWLW